jgi:BMFP domain-containing protein YqiC
MIGRSGLIKDIAQIANGAASALGGVREEIDTMIRQRLERALNARGLVTREEFDALRTRHEAIAARVAVLEATPATGSATGESTGAAAQESASPSAPKKTTARKKAAAKAKKATS